MIRQCCKSTRKGKPCQIEADRELDGLWYCHLHDPNGLYRRQVRGEAPRSPTPQWVRDRAKRHAEYRPRIPDDLIEPPDLTPCHPPFEPTGVYDSAQHAVYLDWILDRELTDSLQAD